MIVLGIETSCDETAVGIVSSGREILAENVLSQIDEHKLYGGVVPEIAARAHLDHLGRLIEVTMGEAGLDFGDLDGVAATAGPGLIGGVMVGLMTGKAIASSQNLPFVAVNHLEAHALTPRLTDEVAFPFLLLLISGMNTQLLLIENVGQFTCLGKAIDDAVGECFDKCGRLLELGYPGGPFIQKAAEQCENWNAAKARYPLPTPMKRRKELDFSFSGLKTALRQHVIDAGETLDIPMLCASFQATVVEILTERTDKAMAVFKDKYPELAGQTPAFVISGGVAANKPIREGLQKLATEKGFVFHAPPLKLCGDNGTMIAWAGIERLNLGLTDSMDAPARPRWPLENT